MRTVPRHAKNSNWRERVHAATVTTGGERTERMLADDREYASVLRELFGVDLALDAR